MAQNTAATKAPVAINGQVVVIRQYTQIARLTTAMQSDLVGGQTSLLRLCAGTICRERAGFSRAT